MSDPVGYVAAFVAGLFSFASPCVLPLIPGYVSFITGYSLSELSRGAKLSRILLSSLLFVAGFTIVFMALGATASVIGSALLAYRDVLRYIGGAMIILLGILLLGVVKVPWLYGEARADMGKARVFGSATALVTGMAFAFGWTPCVGPILGSILALAGTTGSVGQGASLLFVYSLGLGVPFVAISLLLGKVGSSVSWLSRHGATINRVSGILLIAVGLLMVSGRLGSVTGWLTALL
ncbi:MAG: cytochrome c biogenesis protein CcdA [Actinobacteria bacterium]|nr:cytochrome c biogenesis protein CcdA [Actinomycetota bacterium]MCL5888219.1 cytochrome c biogenesis protein CcdA [Actinomycetota bacterium]